LTIPFRPCGFIDTKTLNYLAYQSLDFERTKFDIYVWENVDKKSRHGYIKKMILQYHISHILNINEMQYTVTYVM